MKTLIAAFAALACAFAPLHAGETKPAGQTTPGAAAPAESPPAKSAAGKETKTETPKPAADPAAKNMETISLGAGCFWCVEAVLQRIKGVEKCVSGYTGGQVKDPTYRQVCEGDTGHAEVVQVTYDPAVISTETLLGIFFDLHDPTTLNRQGADRGTQYRSAIYYHTDAQKAAAEKVKAALTAEKKFASPIVTEITKAPEFYAAEGYHQDYFNLNKDKNPYCQVVIVPKLKKLGLLKDSE